MKKIPIKYFIILFVISLAAGIVIRDMDTSKFTIVKSSRAYAPTTAPLYVSGEPGDGVTVDGKININTASEEDLITLDRIGKGLAKRIIEYRTQVEKFEVIQDIMKVSGVGEATFNSIKDYIVAE